METILKHQSKFFAPLRKSPFGGFRGLTNRLVRSFLHDIEDEYRFDSISRLLKTGGTPPPCRACAVEADVIGKNYTAALQEISAMEQQGIEPEFTLLQRTLIDMETMPDKLMSIKTDSVLKTKIETVAVQTSKKGSIHARNLLDMAFHDKVKETYHFPQSSGNNARLINQNNDELTKESDNKLIVSENQEKFNLYPNPNQGMFTFEYVITNEGQLTLQLINLTGKIVYQKTLLAEQGKELVLLNQLNQGIYMVIVKDKNGLPLYRDKLSIIK